MLNQDSLLHSAARFSFIVLASASLLLTSTLLLAQTTISTGSIVGTVTDPTGAVVSGAKVTIRNKATSSANTTTSTSAGTFTSGALIPGDYIVRIEAQGFKSTEVPVVVQVNTTAAANVKLASEERARLDKASAPVLLYPYWHQAKTARERLSPADLSLLGPHIQ